MKTFDNHSRDRGVWTRRMLPSGAAALCVALVSCQASTASTTPPTTPSTGTTPAPSPTPPAASAASLSQTALDALDRDCNAQTPCPQGLVCAPYVIPDLGTRSRCELACQSDTDCLTLTPEADRACVSSFFAHGGCECRAGVGFRRCTQGPDGAQRTCSEGSTFQHMDGRSTCP